MSKIKVGELRETLKELGSKQLGENEQEYLSKLVNNVVGDMANKAGSI